MPGCWGAGGGRSEGGLQKPEKAGDHFSPGALEGTQFCQHQDISPVDRARLLTCRTV